MPESRPVLVVHERDGRLAVTADGVVLVGPCRVDDVGARNLGMVMLTQMGFGVGRVAEAFGLKPGTVSHVRTAFTRGGSAAVVRVSGHPEVLTGQVVAQVRQWLAAGLTQQQAADRLGVSRSAVSYALRRHPAPAPVAEELEFSDVDGPAGSGQADRRWAADEADTSTELALRPAGQVVGPVGSPRLQTGCYPSRYAGAMLAYSYLDRAGAVVVLAGLGGAAWRRFDSPQLATFTVLALLLGVGSIEQVKSMVRSQAGPLVGVAAGPELRTLRPRLAQIAEGIDVP